MSVHRNVPTSVPSRTWVVSDRLSGICTVASRLPVPGGSVSSSGWPARYGPRAEPSRNGEAQELLHECRKARRSGPSSPIHVGGGSNQDDAAFAKGRDNDGRVISRRRSPAGQGARRGTTESEIGCRQATTAQRRGWDVPGCVPARPPARTCGNGHSSDCFDRGRR